MTCSGGATRPSRVADQPIPSLVVPAGAGKPPRSARTLRYDLPADESYRLEPIGVVHSPFQWRDEAPRQPGVAAVPNAAIVLRQGWQNTLQDLAGFSHLWVLAWFHRSRGWKPQIVPPRDTVKRGLFATRAPDRPNPIGLSVVRIVAIFGTRIDIADHDLLDGTPVLDLKPYIPAYDAKPTATAGWVDQLQEPGPDHRLR
jgi:tRNA-Thr(GGU) m(6)t(6)A37 methyltransferase TsaA